jgi:hypothetical protein
LPYNFFYGIINNKVLNRRSNMDRKKKYSPAARQKAVDQMIGGIKERMAQAKASGAEKKKAALARDKSNIIIEPVSARGAASDELAIEDSGTPMRDFHLTPDAPVGEIIFNPQECPDKLEPNPLNLVARESLERQISDIMAKLNQDDTTRKHRLKDALNVLEFARTTAYTHPMGEVCVNLHEGASRLSDIDPELSKKVNRLANLALEVRQSEQLRQNQGG